MSRKTTVAIFAFAFFATGLAHAQMVAVAPLAETAVTTDGLIGAGEWDDANWYYFDGANSAARPGWVDPAASLTTADWACSFALKHDATRIYILTVVTDDVIQNDSAGNQWEDDSMEIYFDPNNSNSNPKEGNETGFQMAYKSEDAGGVGGMGMGDYWFAKATIGPPGYIMEFQVLKARTGMVTGGIYGFDLSPDDDDDGTGRDNQIWWNARDGGSWNIEIPWGDIFLSPNTKAAPAQRATTDLQALYRFEEGSGATVGDLSGVGTPLNLSIAAPANVGWLGGGGLTIETETIANSTDAATKIIAACKASNGLTVEAWLKPSDLEQDGPARIVTLSHPTDGANNRNFTLGENYWAAHDQTPEPTYIMRLRTDGTNNNGAPEIDSGAQTLALDLAHVIYTRDPVGNEAFYLDGVLSTVGTRAGSFANWGDTYQFGLANEFASAAGAREWLGSLHLVAIYSRSLSASEVQQNYNAGPHPSAVTAPGAPTDLTARAGDASVELQWSAAPGAVDGYRILQSETAGGPYTEAAVVDAGTLRHVVTGLTNNTTYHFVVAAFNTAGDGPNSNEASAMPEAGISLPARHWQFYK